MTIATMEHAQPGVSQNRLWLAAGAILIMVTWLFWDFFTQQVRFAINQQADWGHTLVIPFIAGYFVWLKRDQLLAKPFKPAWTGFFILLAGMAWYFLIALGPAAFKHHNLMGFGVGLVLIGLTLLFFGWRSMRWLWFPLLYMIVFSQTISDTFLLRITEFLQDIAAYGSYYGLTLLGYDTSKDGNTIRIFHDAQVIPVNIAEACSGMRMLVAFLALGVAMAYAGFPFCTRYPFLTLRIFFRRLFSSKVRLGNSAKARGLLVIWVIFQRVLLVLLAVPTALFVNVLRVMTLGVLATYDSGLADGDFHSMVGLLWLVPAFFIYLGIMWVLRRIVVLPDEDTPPVVSGSLAVNFSGRARTAFVAACVLMVAGGIGLTFAVNALSIYLRKEPVELRSSLSNIPASLDGWTMLGDYRMSEAGTEELGTELYISRAYQSTTLPGNPVVHFHLAYYTGMIDMVPHVPDRCMVAGGLQVTEDPRHLKIPIDRSQWKEDPEFTIDGEPFLLETTKDWLTGKEQVVRMPRGDFELRTTEFQDPKTPDMKVYAGYFFIANGRLTPTPGGVRLLAYKPSDKYAYYCKVQFTISGKQGLDEEEFLAIVSEFFNPMLIDVMRCLPDWGEVQSQTLNTDPADKA